VQAGKLSSKDRQALRTLIAELEQDEKSKERRGKGNK
jgi:hypothetical protein